MMLGRCGLSTLAVLLTAAAALADGRVIFSFIDDPPALLAYEEECENDAECWTDGISCEDGLITVSMGRLYTDEMVRWMMNGVEGFVFGIYPLGQLNLSKIERADIDGTWSADLVSSGSGPLAADGNEVVFDSTVRRTRVLLDDQNRSALNQFLAMCGR